MVSFLPRPVQGDGVGVFDGQEQLHHLFTGVPSAPVEGPCQVVTWERIMYASIIGPAHQLVVSHMHSSPRVCTLVFFINEVKMLNNPFPPLSHTGPERQDGAGRRGAAQELPHVLKSRQNPAEGPVSPTYHHSERSHVA